MRNEGEEWNLHLLSSILRPPSSLLYLPSSLLIPLASVLFCARPQAELDRVNL